MIIKQTIYGMQDLFENFRKYSILTEEQLLVEGRIDDAKKKYPEVAKPREEYDGESLLDVLIKADPTERKGEAQKYLMGAAKIVNTALERAKKDGYEIFWAKEWPAETSEETPEGTFTSVTDNLVSAWGITRNVAEALPQVS